MIRTVSFLIPKHYQHSNSQQILEAKPCTQHNEAELANRIDGKSLSFWLLCVILLVVAEI